MLRRTQQAYSIKQHQTQRIPCSKRPPVPLCALHTFKCLAPCSMTRTSGESIRSSCVLMGDIGEKQRKGGRQHHAMRKNCCVLIMYRRCCSFTTLMQHYKCCTQHSPCQVVPSPAQPTNSGPQRTPGKLTLPLRRMVLPAGRSSGHAFISVHQKRRATDALTCTSLLMPERTRVLM